MSAPNQCAELWPLKNSYRWRDLKNVPNCGRKKNTHLVSTESPLFHKSPTPGLGNRLLQDDPKHDTWRERTCLQGGAHSAELGRSLTKLRHGTGATRAPETRQRVEWTECLSLCGPHSSEGWQAARLSQLDSWPPPNPCPPPSDSCSFDQNNIDADNNNNSHHIYYWLQLLLWSHPWKLLPGISHKPRRHSKDQAVQSPFLHRPKNKKWSILHTLYQWHNVQRAKLRQKCKSSGSLLLSFATKNIF